jgi:hypothetical protein
VVFVCAVHDSGEARGEGGALDGGAFVGATGVHVPQLPRESLASFHFLLSVTNAAALASLVDIR